MTYLKQIEYCNDLHYTMSSFVKSSFRPYDTHTLIRTYNGVKTNLGSFSLYDISAAIQLDSQYMSTSTNTHVEILKKNGLTYGYD